MQKRTFRSLKSRDDEMFAFPLMFNGARMTFTPVKAPPKPPEPEEEKGLF